MKKLVELKHSVGHQKLAHAMEDTQANKLPYLCNLGDKQDTQIQRTNLDENPQDPSEANASMFVQDVSEQMSESIHNDVIELDELPNLMILGKQNISQSLSEEDGNCISDGSSTPDFVSKTRFVEMIELKHRSDEELNQIKRLMERRAFE